MEAKVVVRDEGEMVELDLFSRGELDTSVVIPSRLYAEALARLRIDEDGHTYSTLEVVQAA